MLLATLLFVGPYSIINTTNPHQGNEQPSTTTQYIGFKRNANFGPHFEYSPSGPGNNFYYVAAFINSNSAPTAVPNSGVQTTIQVVSEQATGCLSFWVDDDAASNIWGQVGYYICNGSTPVAFYQVWNLTTNQVLTTGTYSVSNGYHKFSMYTQNSSNNWAYALDGNTFGSYNMRANVSSTSYGISATTEEGYVNSSYQPAQQVEFSPALQVMQSQAWYPVQLAYEPNGCGSSAASCWGIQGNLQNPTLPTDTIIVGGNTNPVSSGAWLWNSRSPDFTLTATPTDIQDNVGVATNSTITVSPLNGFSASVTLTAATNSTSIACALNSASTRGGSGTSILTCISSVQGNYLVNVTGTSGTISRTISIIYHTSNNPGFTLTSNRTTVTTYPDANANSTLSVKSLNGFTGITTLTVTTNSTSLSCKLAPATITGGDGNSTLSCISPAGGDYQANIAATSSGVPPQTVSVKYRVQDFTISASPTVMVANSGKHLMSTITVAELGGFNGTVILTENATPSAGLACVLSTTTIANGSGTSTLSCSLSTGGVFEITVAGTSGILTRSTKLACECSAPGPVIDSRFYWLMAGVASLSGVLAFAFHKVRARKKSNLKADPSLALAS